MASSKKPTMASYPPSSYTSSSYSSSNNDPFVLDFHGYLENPTEEQTKILLDPMFFNEEYIAVEVDDKDDLSKIWVDDGDLEDEQLGLKLDSFKCSKLPFFRHVRIKVYATKFDKGVHFYLGKNSRNLLVMEPEPQVFSVSTVIGEVLRKLPFKEAVKFRELSRVFGEGLNFVRNVEFDCKSPTQFQRQIKIVSSNNEIQSLRIGFSAGNNDLSVQENTLFLPLLNDWLTKIGTKIEDFTLTIEGELSAPLPDLVFQLTKVESLTISLLGSVLLQSSNIRLSCLRSLNITLEAIDRHTLEQLGNIITWSNNLQDAKINLSRWSFGVFEASQVEHHALAAHVLFIRSESLMNLEIRGDLLLDNEEKKVVIYTEIPTEARVESKTNIRSSRGRSYKEGFFM